MQIANEILAQLGGNRFLAMTGAKDLVGGEDYLAFRLPARFAKGGINKVKITLTDADLYKVESFKMKRHGLDVVTIAEDDGIYCDRLAETFTAQTGLDTRL